MTLLIDLTPQEEEHFRAFAAKNGAEPSAMARKLIVDTLAKDIPNVDEENTKAIAQLQAWRREDATDDPDEIAKAEADLAEFKRNVNTNRALGGETQVYH